MFVVAFMLLTQLLSASVFAAIEGETIGGKTGNLKIFYDLSIAKTSAYASTTQNFMIQILIYPHTFK